MIEGRNDPLFADLDAIRSAVATADAIRLPWKENSPVDLVDQGRRMQRRLETWLLDDEQKQMLGLQPWDQYILHASAYLCDIGLTNVNGMPPAVDGLTGGSATDSFCEALYARTNRIVRENWQDLGLPNATVAGVIARVCVLAGTTHGGNAGPAESDSALIADTAVNVALLAAYLRIGLALDPETAGTIWHISRQLPDGVRGLPGCIEDYFTVSDVGPHPYISSTIRMKIHCTNPEVHRALKRHERVVQQLLEGINQTIRPRFLYSDVIYEIEPKGYTPIDLKFSVDSSAGLQLFMGNRLYSDKRAFLRELIQNAVDACNYRKLADDTYAPSIELDFNEDISVIKIRDNGIGMNRQWIEKYFLSIGISFYQSTEIKSADRNSQIDFGFISQFGIGFLSSFLVADQIVIKTRKASSPGLRISISGLREYFDVRELEEEAPIGTEVTLYLKKSKLQYSRSVEFVGYLKTNIRFLKVPVRLKDERGNQLTIGREQMAYNTKKSGAVAFVTPLAFPDSEGYLQLCAQTHGPTIFALQSAMGGVSVFQDGIFVTQSDVLLPEGARQNVVARINLMGKDKCGLSIDRNRIFWTAEQQKEIKRIVRYGLVEVTNQLMAALTSQEAQENTVNSIVNHLAIFFDFSEVDDRMYRRLCDPIREKVAKRFRDFIRIHFAHSLKTGGRIEAGGYSETWQQEMIESFAHRQAQRK